MCDPTWWFKAFFILRATQKKTRRQSEVARLYLFIFPPTWDLTDQVGKEEPKEICLSAPPRLHILSLGLLNKLCSTRYRFFNFTSCKISQTCAQLTSLIPSSGLCLTALLSSSPAWACVLGLLMVTSFSSQAGPVAQSSAPCLSPAHSGSLRNSLALDFSFKSLLSLQGICSARAAALFIV